MPQDIESIRTAMYFIAGPSLLALLGWFLRKMAMTLDRVAETCAQLKHESAGMQRDLGRVEGGQVRHTEDISELKDRVTRLEASK